MPGCPTITLQGVTRTAWDGLKAEARRIGVSLPADDAGSVAAHGAGAGYRWSEATATLEVTFTDLPQWIDCGSVERRLRDAVRACGGR